MDLASRSRAARIGFVVALTALVACRDKASSGSSTSTSASASARAGVLVKRPKASPSAVVDRWNEAHTKHDAAALASLYGARVQFYGKSVANADCVAAKKKALAADPTYTQSIRDLRLITPPKGGSVTSARFVKISTSRGKSTEYPSTLIIDGNGLIIGETDDVTDKNLSDMIVATYDWCLDDDEREPNEKLKPPFEITAKRALAGLVASKTFATRAASVPAGHGYGIDGIQCPMSCDRAAGTCSYDFRVVDPALTGSSRLVDWLHVDAVNGTITREGAAGSEPLPP